MTPSHLITALGLSVPKYWRVIGNLLCPTGPPGGYRPSYHTGLWPLKSLLNKSIPARATAATNTTRKTQNNRSFRQSRCCNCRRRRCISKYSLSSSRDGGGCSRWLRASVHSLIRRRDDRSIRGSARRWSRSRRGLSVVVDAVLRVVAGEFSRTE